jgi:hypothetical protein
MASFLDVCRFSSQANPGTADFVYSAATTGYQSPALAGAVNGATYRYRAESVDLSLWEIGYGTYSTSTGTITRSVVLFNSAGTGSGSGQSGAGSKINFASTTPQVGFTLLAEDLNTGSAFLTFRFVATAGQTAFTGPDANALPLIYSPGNVMGTRNGVMLTNGQDYTATTGNVITLLSAAAAGDEILFFAYNTGPLTTYNTATQYKFTATAGQTVFTGADDNGAVLVTNGAFTVVTANGAVVNIGADYTLTSSALTLLLAAAAGDVITVLTINTNNLSAITQPDLNNSTLAATTAYADNKVSWASVMALSAASQKLARANIGVDDRNIIINGDFRINQRAYVTGTAKAAGVYTHDRWKAGAGGATYTFAQLASSTTITITAGTLIQAVEDKNVEGGTYVLSWTGTAQARAGVNSGAPSGSYSVSPLIIAGQTAGTIMSIEFNTGTLGKVKLELGSVPTPFVMTRYANEFTECQRYYETGGVLLDCAVNPTTTVRQVWITYVVQKRVAPTLSTSSPNGSPTVNGNNATNFSAFSTAATTYMAFNWTADAEL